MKQEPKPTLNYSPSPSTSKQDGCPPAKKIRMDIEETLARLKSLDTPSQLELWRRMLTTHPFNLGQLKLLRTAIDDRIKLDIVSAVPYEIALYIMSFLCPKDLCQAAQTCRSWRVVCEDNRLWREKCREEGLMDDEQAMGILFKERIENSTKIHQKFAMDCLSITSDSSDWKVAYLKHMSVLRNWRSRAFKVKEPTLTDIPPSDLQPCLTPQPTQPQPAQVPNAQYPAADLPARIGGLAADEFRQLCELILPPDPNSLQRAAPQRRPPEKAKRQVARPSPDLALRLRTIRQQQMRQLPQRLKQARQCPQLIDQQLQKQQQQRSQIDVVLFGFPEESRSPSCDQDPNQKLMQLRCHEDSVITCLQYNSRTNTVVSGSDDMTLKVWSSETGKCIATLEGHSGGVWSSQLSPEDIVISGATDRTIKIWRAHTGELLRTLHGHSSTVRCLALNGDRVVSGSRDTTLRLWDVETGHCIEVLAGHTQAVRCVEFKGDIIVSGAYDHLVMVWDAKTQQRIHTLDCHANRIYSLQFDGKTIASGSLDSTICIWDVETGKLRQHLEGHSSLTSKMQLKDNILVSANADSYCKVWDVNTGECLRTLEGPNKHTSAITSVYFDTRHVVTSSDDGTVKLWDVNTGEFIRNLIVLPTADKGGVVWRIRASYSKLICAVGSRTETEDTHLLVLDFE